MPLPLNSLPLLRSLFSANFAPPWVLSGVEFVYRRLNCIVGFYEFNQNQRRRNQPPVIGGQQPHLPKELFHMFLSFLLPSRSYPTHALTGLVDNASRYLIESLPELPAVTERVTGMRRPHEPNQKFEQKQHAAGGSDDCPCAFHGQRVPFARARKQTARKPSMKKEHSTIAT